MSRLVPLAVALALLSTPFPAAARGGNSYSSHGSSSHSSSRSVSGTRSNPVHVDGYTRKDGTYVAPHKRPEPGYASHSKTTNYTTRSTTHSTGGTVERDSHGKIKRSESAKNAFKRTHPCPSTGKSSGACPGYVIDHVKPLKRGGADDPFNMQWQTTAEAKAKDKWE